MQISRLFEIVYILMNKKNTTAKELCEHFEVSQRTIYRDIETLCQAGIPIYTTKGKGGGIALMDNFVLNKSVLSEQEQNEILAALSGFKAATNANSDQVIHKLGALFGNKSSDWIEVDFSNWNNNILDKNKFNQIKDAILNHDVLTFHYYNSGGQESYRLIEPYKLQFRGQAWYLFGNCLDKKDFRYFKITRIRDLEVKDEKFILNPAIAKAKEEPSEAISYPTIAAVLKVDAKMGFRVYDEFPAENITKALDGSFLIRANLHGGSWLTGYLLSFEDHLEVLEPAQLREEMIQKIKNSLSKYDS
jgi:predicted DNA-binding transcriptional regulator YafY